MKRDEAEYAVIMGTGFIWMVLSIAACLLDSRVLWVVAMAPVTAFLVWAALYLCWTFFRAVYLLATGKVEDDDVEPTFPDGGAR